MTFEKVQTVGVYWDGVRTGTANFRGAPHYFDCRFDEGADEYSDVYQLYPVDSEFMERELRLWAIFRAWEDSFHRGLLSVETHPGHGGVDQEYDDLRRWMDNSIRLLEPLPEQHTATFRVAAGQESVPRGVLRELEVAWTSASA